LTSSAFESQAEIPHVYSDYGEKISPPLSWSAGPEGTKSYVIVVEDPDANTPRPYVHWVLYNLPPQHTSLPLAVPTAPRLPHWGGALQGRNTRNTFGYFGPRPPTGDPAHHYHFQVFAVDRMLELNPGATLEQLHSAMEGHILAKGELVGT